MSNTTGNNGILRITKSGGDIYIQGGATATSGSGTKINFAKYQTTTTTMTVDISNSRVGIGTTAPDAPLQIDGEVLIGQNNNSTTTRQLRIGGMDGDKIFLTHLGSAGSKITHGSGWGLQLNAGPGNVAAGIISLRTSAVGTNNYVDRLLVNSSGNVGIGTTFPISLLHVGKNENITLTIGSNQWIGTAANNTTVGLERSRNTIQFTAFRDATADRIGAKIVAINKQTYTPGSDKSLIQSTDLAFFTVPVDAGTQNVTDETVERMRITDSGRVGIGTSTPQSRLSLGSSIDSKKLAMWENADGSSFFGFGVTENTLHFHAATASGTVNGQMVLLNTGRVGIGNPSPATTLDVNGSQIIRDNTSGSFGSNLSFFKSNNNGTTADNTEFGYIGFVGRDGSNTNKRWAYIMGAQDGAATSTQVPGRLTFVTTNSTTGEAERMRIDSQGRVGIGIIPSYQLDVNGPIWCRGDLHVGSNDTRNQIRFRGTAGESPGTFDRTVIGENIYETGTEKSELLLFKADDGATPSGPDRVRVLSYGGFQVDIATTGTWPVGGAPPTTGITTAFTVSPNNTVTISGGLILGVQTI
jgi:hypothetical protein